MKSPQNFNPVVLHFFVFSVKITKIQFFWRANACYSVPDWAIFTSTWQQIVLQKQPKYFSDLGAISNHVTLTQKGVYLLYGQFYLGNQATFYSIVCSHCLLHFHTKPRAFTRLLEKDRRNRLYNFREVVILTNL